MAFVGHGQKGGGSLVIVKVKEGVLDLAEKRRKTGQCFEISGKMTSKVVGGKRFRSDLVGEKKEKRRRTWWAMEAVRMHMEQALRERERKRGGTSFSSVSKKETKWKKKRKKQCAKVNGKKKRRTKKLQKREKEDRDQNGRLRRRS